jgi:hypothetical protein
MPGYLPESDPAVFSEWKDARAYLVEEIDRFWDEDQDISVCNDDPCAHVPPHVSLADDKWLTIHTQLPLASEDESFVMMNGDGSLVFWITQSTNEEFNIAGDGS